MLATENREPVVVKSLLGCDGIDVNSKDSNGDTALHLAADFRVSANNYTSIEFRSKEMAQNTEVARLILGCKDINVGMKNKMEETPLMLAVRNSNTEVVKLLVERDDVDVNSKNRYGETALLIAVRNRSNQSRFLKDSRLNLWIQVGRLLLERDDIDVNAGDANGQTPLEIAARSPHGGLARLLLAEDNRHAKLNNKNGNTPQWLATRINQNRGGVQERREREQWESKSYDLLNAEICHQNA